MARAGHFHLDPETKGIGVNVPGAFAEYLKIPAFNAIHLPSEVDDEVGAILDPLGNAVHTALSYELVGEDVLITGAGPIGIMQAVQTLGQRSGAILIQQHGHRLFCRNGGDLVGNRRIP